MRKLLFVAVLAGYLLFATLKDYGQGRPIPPGVREADKQINAQINEPPAKFKHKLADPAKLQEEADTLAKLSAEIPGQIELVIQGQFPKDLEGQLKRVEKLAKHLRSEVVP